MDFRPFMPNGRMHSPACPVQEIGLELRAQCDGCTGLPINGQSRLERRGVLYAEDDAARYVYAVVEGYLRETRLTSDGRLQGVRVVGPGDVVGTEGIVRDTYQSGVEAVTSARVCRIAIDAVRERMMEQPSLAMAMTELLCRQSISLRQSIVMLGSLSAEERVLALLDDLTKHAADGAWVELPFTRQELGDFLGLALATVSRAIHRLARRGMLDVKGRRIRLERDAMRLAVV